MNSNPTPDDIQTLAVLAVLITAIVLLVKVSAADQGTAIAAGPAIKFIPVKPGPPRTNCSPGCTTGPWTRSARP